MYIFIHAFMPYFMPLYREFIMNRIIVTLNNSTGLHARPATLVVKEASKFKSKITIKKVKNHLIPKELWKFWHWMPKRRYT